MLPNTSKTHFAFQNPIFKNMKTLLSALFLFCLFSPSIAQEVGYSDLVFHHEMEASFFQADFLEDHTLLTEQVGLLMAVDTALTQSAVNETVLAIEQLSNKLRAAQIQRKKPLKAVKLLHETIHEDVLRKYDIDAQFTDLFKDGRYNCVTAVALYALLLEDLELPYELRELPNHVYLVYAPATAAITVETTDGAAGVYEADAASYGRFLTDLNKATPLEIQGKSTEEMYQEYMADHEKGIDLRGLASDLYFNAAIQAADHEDLESALALIKKSVYLNRRENKVGTWAAILQLLLSDLDWNNLSSFEPLFALQYFPDYETQALDQIGRRFCFAVNHYLIEENQLDYYLQIKKHFQENLHPELPRPQQQLEFIHDVHMGWYYLFLEQIDSAYSHFDRAYQFNPDHLHVQSGIKSVVGVELLERSEQGVLKAYTYIQEEHQKYPFLDQNEYFHELLVYGPFWVTIEAFETNQGEEGLAAFEQCRSILENGEDGSKQFDGMVGSLFGSASSYYFRKGDEVQARKWLQDGLAVAPKSAELVRKWRLLEDFYDN